MFRFFSKSFECPKVGTGFAFAVLYLATSCVKYGRLAEKKPAGVTLASQTPQKGLRLSRRLFKELRLSQSFNGVASSSPEVGLLEMQSSGKASPHGTPCPSRPVDR